MSSNINSNILTKDQLFACLEYDGVDIDADTINKAKNDDGQALRDIGYKYNLKTNYPKAMLWYQLAAAQNNTVAYNDIGFLYHKGYHVPQNYITSMEYYLKAARCNNTISMSNIGILFLYGDGVPIDKYKALEWFLQSGSKPDHVKKLNQDGFHLIKEDKHRTIYQLVNEAEDLIRYIRMTTESKLRKEIKDLNKVISANETKMESARTEYQKLQIESQQKQQLKDQKDIIALLHRLVQSKANENELLQKDSQSLRNLGQTD